MKDRLYALVSHNNPLCYEERIDLCRVTDQTIYIAEEDVCSIPILTAFLLANNPGVPLRTTRYTDTEIMNACTASSFYLSEFFYAQRFVTFRLIPLVQDISFDAGFAYLSSPSPLVQQFIQFSEDFCTKTR